MDWMEIAIDTAHGGLETVCARLTALGIDGLCVQDEAEFRAFWGRTASDWELVDPALRNHMKGLCRILFYLPADAEETLLAVRRTLASLPSDCPETPLGALGLHVGRLREEDWAENWKQYYKSVPIGERLLVQPSWEPPPDGENRVVFLNNPGLSFGTGEHETTRLCLEQIERLIVGGEHVLDVGCGSGILSICALLLGAAMADALDIDPQAVSAARQNAGSNGLDGGRYRVGRGNLLEPAYTGAWLGPYHLITANITADVLAALCPALAGRLASGGVLVLSGIIEQSRECVVRAIDAAGLRRSAETSLRGWHCFTAYKQQE